MNKTRKNTAFYIEILALLLLLLFGIAVLVQVFGTAREMGREAQELSAAVPLAHNAAEAVAACDDALALGALLGKDAAVQPDGVVLAYYTADGKPTTAQAAHFTVKIVFSQGQGTQKAAIAVLRAEKEVYSLETENYRGRS